MDILKNRKYLVEADHPIFKRIYQFHESFDDAFDLACEAKDLNYENITINGKEPKDYAKNQEI